MLHYPSLEAIDYKYRHVLFTSSNNRIQCDSINSIKLIDLLDQTLRIQEVLYQTTRCMTVLVFTHQNEHQEPQKLPTVCQFVFQIPVGPLNRTINWFVWFLQSSFTEFPCAFKPFEWLSLDQRQLEVDLFSTFRDLFLLLYLQRLILQVDSPFYSCQLNVLRKT